MLKLVIPYSANTPGVNTTTLLFSKIQEQHPTLLITEATHYIKKVQQMPTRYEPWQSVVEIGSKTDTRYSKLFQYARWPISRYITNPLFTAPEVLQVKEMDEKELVAFLKTKLALNLNNVDFLVKPDGISYTGGNKQPNWRITAAPNSPFWYSDKIIWLHDGTPVIEPPDPDPDPEPEPVVNYQRLFPIDHVAAYLGQGEDYVDPYMRDHIGKTVFLRCPAEPNYKPDIFLVCTPELTVGTEVRYYNTMSDPYLFIVESESYAPGTFGSPNQRNVNVIVNGRSPTTLLLASGGMMRAILMEVVEEDMGDNVFTYHQTWHIVGATIVRKKQGPQ